MNMFDRINLCVDIYVYIELKIPSQLSKFEKCFFTRIVFG